MEGVRRERERDREKERERERKGERSMYINILISTLSIHPLQIWTLT